MLFRSAAAAAAIVFAATSAYAADVFEVASIKPQPWTGQGNSGVFVHGSTLSGEHVCLNDLIQYAWNLRPVQLSGGPAWAERGKLDSSDLYQVVAKAPGDKPPSAEQFRTMLQGLLAERFQLRVRHATKDLPVYKLVVAKNGPKLKESAADTKFALAIGPGQSGKSSRIVAKHVAIPQLLFHLEYPAGRPVTDATGLAGFYDFELEYAQENMAASSGDAGGPSLFTSLQAQLGLKLEPGTAPFDMVVIEHAEKPSAN
jgi:uncharacterized protein (TIGR03435 family)